MRIFYVTNARLPTEKAHGLATVKLCEALAKKGVEVTIFAPRRINPLRQDIYEYYRAERNFKIIFLPSLDLIWLGFGQRFFFLLQLFSFSLVSAFWLFSRYYLMEHLRDVAIFSHDHIPLFFTSFFAPRIFYDIHHYPEHTIFYKRVLRNAFGIGVQTKWKIEALFRDFGAAQDKIVYWPNGTDVERFDLPFSVQEARVKLGLPMDRKIALYTGSLQSWKGVETLVAAAEFLPADIVVYIVGGEQREIEVLKTLNPKPETLNPIFVGQRPWAEIPLWLKAADVLVLPNTGREKVSRFYTSPMKLFEYMASGCPIVASGIPSVREIVDETMVFFAAPDDPCSFARAIQGALNNPSEAVRRAERVRQEARKYTWDARAEKILSLINLSKVEPSL